METTDLEQINKWIFNRLSGEQMLVDLVGVNEVVNVVQFYSGKAPQSAHFPYIEYRLMSNAPVRGGGNKRIFGRPKYQIKIVVQGDSEAAYEAEVYPHYARMRRLFEQTQDSTDQVVIGCSIANELVYWDTAEGGEKQAHLLYQLEFFSYN